MSVGGYAKKKKQVCKPRGLGQENRCLGSMAIPLQVKPKNVEGKRKRIDLE